MVSYSSDAMLLVPLDMDPSVTSFIVLLAMLLAAPGAVAADAD